MFDVFLNPHRLLAIAVVLLLLALCFRLYDLSLWLYRQRQMKSQLSQQQRQYAQDSIPITNQLASSTPARWQQVLQAMIRLGSQWKEGRYGNTLLAKEDKTLIDLAGFYDNNLAQSLFIFSRTLFSLGLPLLFFAFTPSFRLMNSFLLTTIFLGFLGFALGWMLPKWYIQRRVKSRKKAIALELLLFVDILRLLQGVGLSIDQALITITQQFHPNMPVLAYELSMAQDLYARGRTREQSFNRLIHQFQNEDLSAICRLIQQIDVHGGAVQEPLNSFSQRLQEDRRLFLKERIGILTVKMTGVMIITLMPALIIVTGGAGFLAVIRGLTRVTGGM